MGLDSVEIILRSEEFFAVAIEDHEASSVRTVGEFYQVICAKLNVTPATIPGYFCRAAHHQRMAEDAPFSP